ncbi:MAG: spmB [Bacillales bacterium]|jgi:spore maturation protein B|nr:spmB [Bacillales bacterium]
MLAFFTYCSVLFIPIIIATIVIYGTIKNVPTFEAFVEGSKEGVSIVLSILPFLIGMLVAIYMFRASGAMDILVNLFSPLFTLFGIPKEVAPLAFVKSISGTASLGLVSELIAKYGPDSLIGRLASTIQGSSDTTLFIITVYFGSVGIKKIGDSLKVGLLADFLGILTSVFFVYIFFY